MGQGQGRSKGNPVRVPLRPPYPPHGQERIRRLKAAKDFVPDTKKLSHWEGAATIQRPTKHVPKPKFCEHTGIARAASSAGSAVFQRLHQLLNDFGGVAALTSGGHVRLQVSAQHHSARAV